MTEPLVFEGPEGSITVTAAALAELVASAARSVDGVRVRRPRRAVEVGSRTAARRSRSSSARCTGSRCPSWRVAVQERVGDALARVSGLEVERVDVEIEEIG